MNCILCGSEFTRRIKLYRTDEIIGEYIKMNSKLNEDDIKKFLCEEAIFLRKCFECNLQFYENALAADEEFYMKLDDNNPDYYRKKRDEFNYAIDKILELNVKKILEVGAGSGHFADKIKNIFDITVSELNPNAIENLKRKNHVFDTSESKYDLVVSFQVLEHVDDPKEFISFMLDKLNDNGYLLIMVPNDSSDYSRIFSEAPLNLPPHHMSRWDKTSLESIAKIFRLQVVDYYEEQMKILDFDYMIDSLRRDIPLKGLFNTDEDMTRQKELINIFNRTVSPYFFLNKKYTGHSHGILLKKIEEEGK